MDAFAAGNLLCALIYGSLALLLAMRSGRSALVLVLIAACSATGFWALISAFESEHPLLAAASGVFETLHIASWLGFLFLAYQRGLGKDGPSRDLRWLLAVGGVLSAFVIVLALPGGLPQSGPLLRWSLGARLVLGIGGLVLVDALFRSNQEESSWRVRYLCMGVGGLLGYDLFFYSDSLLFGRVDPILHASRGAVKAIAGPFIAVAAARNAEWSAQLHVSRRAVQNSVVLIGTGIYLLGLSAAGGLLRALEGDWARLLEVIFFFCGAVLLALLLLSSRLRVSLREWVSRHLFTYRNDYREQWQRFSQAFSSAAPHSSLRERAFQAVSGVVGSDHGGIWLLDSDLFVRVVGLGLPREAGDEPLAGRFSRELAERGDQIIEISDELDSENAREMEWLPGWLRGGSSWLLIPLVRHGTLMGFIVLSHPSVRRRLHWEDRELLQTVASQAASHLAEEQNTRALEESRRFEELSRGFAFMAHDLRNLANELSLSLSNARRHIQKPEFQRDMLLSMEESVGAMKRLLDRLSARSPQQRSLAHLDLTRLLGGWLHRQFSNIPMVQLDLDSTTPLPIVGDGDRLVAISGHLIQNAIEAAGPTGRVGLRLHREANMALLEVADDGCGMSPEFVRERLLRPFGSSKSHGMGLGLYECGQIARELGGELDIESEPGHGTVARLRLPLAPGATGEPGSDAST